MSEKEDIVVVRGLSDATAMSIMEELNLNREQAEEIVGSVASLKISAKKP